MFVSVTQKFEKNINVLFSSFLLYSENVEDVLVTIAEATCDVDYSNKTCIICMTNAHTSSGWAPVHVSLRSTGLAKRVTVLWHRVASAVEKLALREVKSLVTDFLLC